MPIYAIGDLARTSGCAVQTVRHYEQIGLLPQPGRTSGNQRRYGEDDLRRLRFIRHARDLGFDLDAIRDLLRLDASGPSHDADAIARRHLDVVEDRIVRLTIMRDELRTMLAACAVGASTGCRVLDVLGDHTLCHAEHRPAAQAAE